VRRILLALLVLLATAFVAEAGPPQTFKNPKDGAIMVLIPAGEFLMGSEESPGKTPSDEQPAHKVYLDAFYIDKYEVTNTRYERYDPKHRRSKYSACNDCPVTNVSWEEAKNYCTWAGGRLPTEAEWEKAARGPQNYLYTYGNTYNQKLARTGRPWPEGAVKVGLYPPNDYGVYDMTGNVWEWCSDWYAKYYYGVSPNKNPQGPARGMRRVLRGGAWNTGPQYAYAANRGSDEPVMRFHSFGFRCARGIN
jgi:formylglycine-generating enzyme required for sulfatase activity